MNFIAHDWCGWNNRFGRYTHMPSGDTLLCQDWMGQREWDQAQFEWFQKYPGLSVYECPGPYTAEGTQLMGTTDEICLRLEQRLNNGPLASCV